MHILGRHEGKDWNSVTLDDIEREESIALFAPKF